MLHAMPGRWRAGREGKPMNKGSRARWIVPLLVFGALVVRELRKPADERTWHGEIAGVVPYDLRPPTLGRVRRSW